MRGKLVPCWSAWTRVGAPRRGVHLPRLSTTSRMLLAVAGLVMLLLGGAVPAALGAGKAIKPTEQVRAKRLPPGQPGAEPSHRRAVPPRPKNPQALQKAKGRRLQGGLPEGATT